MNQSKISVRYARALFSLAEEKNLLEAIRDDMLLVSNIFKQVAEINIILENPIVNTSGKQKIFAEIFKGRLNDLSLSFIDFIVKNKREKYIRDIIRNFFDLYRAAKGIKVVHLTTAIPIDEQLKSEISAIIHNLLNCNIELQHFIKEDLLGGYILRIDDKQYDASIATKLKELKREMINTTFDERFIKTTG
ncbi:MAG: ATP synthase F1 subunit delta [Bacteroidia bacterium]|nr:ATP synthase F1 subunit delta [Bacteroidia bacterium]